MWGDVFNGIACESEHVAAAQAEGVQNFVVVNLQEIHRRIAIVEITPSAAVIHTRRAASVGPGIRCKRAKGRT
jgi:hypothetical protein